MPPHLFPRPLLNSLRHRQLLLPFRLSRKSEAGQQRRTTLHAPSTLCSTAGCLACGMSRSLFHTTVHQQQRRCAFIPFSLFLFDHFFHIDHFKLSIPRSHFRAFATITPSSTEKAISDALLQVGIAASSATCRRVLHDARDEAAYGEHDEQFRQLTAYFEREKQADATTTTDIDIDAETHQLRRCFIAWGVSAHIITRVRPLVTLDGTHLVPEGTGIVCFICFPLPTPFTHSFSAVQLLLLVAEDSLNQLIPLAAAIVPSESEDSWVYFLQHSRGHMPHLDEAKMVLMSDRCKGLENAVAAVCPNLQHIHCIIHLERNIVVGCGAEALDSTKAFIYEAATATNGGAFELAMSKIKDVSQPVFDFLSKLDPPTWTQARATGGRAYFRTVTSNAAESMNAVLLDARRQGPVALLTTLRGWLFQKFAQRRATAEAATGVFVPAMQLHIEEEAKAAKAFIALQMVSTFLCRRLVCRPLQSTSRKRRAAVACSRHNMSSVHTCLLLSLLSGSHWHGMVTLAIAGSGPHSVQSTLQTVQLLTRRLCNRTPLSISCCSSQRAHIIRNVALQLERLRSIEWSGRWLDRLLGQQQHKNCRPLR